MEQSRVEQAIDITPPNIDDPEAFNNWLDQYIQKPFLGYQDKKHPDGTSLTVAEQIEQTREQLRIFARELPREKVLHVLVSIAKKSRDNP